MNPIQRTSLRLVFLFLATLSIGAIQAQARQGFYLGGGFASVSPSGDLNGTQTLTNPSGTEVEILGKLGSGTGYALEIGYGFNSYLGIEGLITQTHHTASTNPSVIADTTADVTLGLLALRLTAPVSKGFELFARYGAASGAIHYADYSIQVPSGATGQLSLTGSGSGYGAGFEIIGDHFGFELGYNVISVAFNQAIGTNAFGSFPTHNENFTATTATVLYHF